MPEVATAEPDLMSAIDQHNQWERQGGDKGPPVPPPQDQHSISGDPPVKPDSTGKDLEAEMLAKRQAQQKEQAKKEITKEVPKEQPKGEQQKQQVQKKEEKKPDPKDVLSKFGEDKKPEESAEDDAKKQKDQSRWMELKGKEKRLTELEQEHTRKVSEYEAKIKELEQKAWKEEERKEFEELRVRRSAWEVESTPEWHRQITQPFQVRENYINQAAQYYGIDPSKLWEALDLQAPFARNDKIEEIIASVNAERQAKAEADGTPFKPLPTTLSATLSQAGNDLQAIYQAMEAHRKHAMEQATALESQKTLQTKEQEEAEVKQYQEAQNSISSELEKKFPDLFPNEETKLNGLTLKQAVAGALPGEDARTIAYQTMAGEILPYLRHENLALREKLKAYEQEKSDRNKTVPGMQQTNVKLPKERDKDVPQTLDEAIAMQSEWARRGGH